MKTSLLFSGLVVTLVLVVLVACKKDSDKKQCWQVWDQMGNPMGVVCDKTESEVRAAYGDFYDHKDAPRFCWLVKRTGMDDLFLENQTEKMLRLWNLGGTATKAECDYCQTWNHREKHSSKITGEFVYSQVTRQRFCGDTCKTLFAGRQIPLRDTPDSLIIVEFMARVQ